ncbi:MAG TPA: DNA repair protein RadC [Thermoanaerobaculia bacterium]|jgi:DNA repair protein RadC|nr:DNA repair protein RadC [Thermoanaerobaculia bacterium]
MHELIADLPLDDRPRERMLMHGAETLSDAELLAVLLGSGLRGKNAIQLARELLDDGFASLARCDAEQLAKRNGIGEAKATRIVAAFEIARRLANVRTDDPSDFDADLFGRNLIIRSKRLRQERLGALLLDSRNRILRDRTLYVGTVDRAFVSAREVIRLTLDANAAGVVLYHNHPSGDPTPSNEDNAYSRKTRTTLNSIDIDLVDHIIAGAHSFVSMKRKGTI